MGQLFNPRAEGSVKGCYRNVLASTVLHDFILHPKEFVE